MGKIFPKIDHLKNNPNYLAKTISLIERSFKYKKNYSFSIDFAPLINPKNFENCFIMIDEKENVIAHVGSLSRSIKIHNQIFKVVMLGAIAVDENFRGQGYFKKIFTHVVSEFKNDCSFFLLWSNVETLYEQFGFYLCGPQYEEIIKPESLDFNLTKFKDLNQNDFESIKNLYEQAFKKDIITFERSEEDWSQLIKIESSDLYVKRENGKIVEYYIKNKGMDLTEIIYEYSNLKECGKGIVWKAKKTNDSDIEQYQFMLAPGDINLFSEFINAYTSNKIRIKLINQMKKEIYFEFNNELLFLPLDEFLHGVLGPEFFEDLGEIRPLFISGLDSI